MDVHTNGHNGHSPGASAADEGIDLLYAWWPGTQTAPAPLPEAAFSLTLKGQMGGQDAMITVRAMTPESFKRNLESIKGLLDPVQTPAQRQPVQADTTQQCPEHGAMKASTKGKGFYCPHKTPEGVWCAHKAK